MQNHHVAGHKKFQGNYFFVESLLSELRKLEYTADVNTTKFKKKKEVNFNSKF